MIRKQNEGIHWLEFEILAEHPRLRHGSFLRHGGVSHGPFETLNLSNAVGDIPKDVATNRQRVAAHFANQHLVSAPQVHGSHIIKVDGHGHKLPPADALTTARRQLPLMIHHADCQAALFYDPVENAIAAAHSGWRGSVKNIYKETIDFMKVTYGTQPQNLLVGISPSLGPSHAQFINYTKELPPHLWDYQVKPCYFDFWAISEMQLKNEGVLAHHIEMARMCTFANDEDCYSYRRQGIRGGHGTLLMLL